VVRPDEVHNYHRNPRRGDIGAIARSLKKHSQYKPITVNIGTYTGRPNEVLAGNHTLLAIRQLADSDPDDERWQNVKVHWGDWDEDQCRAINLADNRTAELGGYDDAELLSLISEVPQMDLDAIGYTQSDIDALEKVVADMDLEPGERGSAEKTALWAATIGDPDIQPDAGSVWRLGHHTLVVCSLHKEWSVWAPMLKPGMLFAPYPSLLLPYTEIALATPMLMVQPSAFIAGWILTKWNRINSDDPVKQA
jgi:hypothetical protein